MKKILVISGITLLLAGTALFAPLTYFWAKQKFAISAGPQTVVAATPAQVSPVAKSGEPVRLKIPSLHMDLVVIDGLYNQKTGAWTLTRDKAQFATITTKPNDISGNTLIYGHYRPEVFAYLHHIVKGAKVYLYTDNGYKFSYTYHSTEATSPRDTSIFLYQGKPRLTIQTCSGAFMQNRQMYYFSFDTVVKVSK